MNLRNNVADTVSFKLSRPVFDRARRNDQLKSDVSY